MSLPRKKIISANWKMNITASEVPYYLNTLLLAIKNIAGVDILLFPPFTSLPKVSDSLAGSQSVRLGAQNMSPHPKGAFTGEISASMLRDLFVHYILIGHSERRHLFGETNTMIHDKIVAAHLHQIRPILCIGETLEERNAGKEKQVLEEQLRVALKDLSDNDIENTIIAYEPVWAIGTGCTATVAQAQEAHCFIRKIIPLLPIVLLLIKCVCNMAEASLLLML